MTAGFVPPPYPYERLEGIKSIAEAHDGGLVDLSIGTPCDPPPPAVIRALATSDTERGYPPSVGTAAFRRAAVNWMARRFDVALDVEQVGACVGTKEFVGTLPQWLHLLRPERDTILYPAVSYPTYAMGATLAGCRAVPVPLDAQWRLDLGAISADDARRALCLWVNSPANPTGALDDLGAAAAWGRSHDVIVFSDECYVEFTWDAAASTTILSHGIEGVVAVHSLSKRSNLAGLRVGFYAGDARLVHYLQEVRKHVGLLVAGPVQAAATVALDDDTHVGEQRSRYGRRLRRMAAAIEAWSGRPTVLPAGGFYLWIPAPDGQAWAYAQRLAEEGGVLVSPGDLYGEDGRNFVRLALVQPDDRIELVARRLGAGEVQPSSSGVE